MTESTIKLGVIVPEFIDKHIDGLSTQLAECLPYQSWDQVENRGLLDSAIEHGKELVRFSEAVIKNHEDMDGVPLDPGEQIKVKYFKINLDERPISSHPNYALALAELVSLALQRLPKSSCYYMDAHFDNDQSTTIAKIEGDTKELVFLCELPTWEM